MLTEEHELYQNNVNVTLCYFINDIEAHVLCQGITIPDQNAAIYIKKHVIPKSFSFRQYCENLPGSRFHQDEYFRSVKCKLLVPADNDMFTMQ